MKTLRSMGLSVALLLPVLATPQKYSPAEMKSIQALEAAASETKVHVKSRLGEEIVLKPEEKTAFLFMDAISAMETDCHFSLHRPCSLEELVKGSSGSQSIGRLKFDPALDENYKYSVKTSSEGWSAEAKPQHPGLGGLFYDGMNRSMARSYFNPAGPATSQSTELGDAVVLGSFHTN